MKTPNESAEYRVAREALLLRELELRRTMEAVAAERRALPPGGVVPEDYVFERMSMSGMPEQVHLSELFSPGKDSLIVYNFMFPRHSEDDRPSAQTGPFAILPKEKGPCPSCVGFLDQLDGTALHVGQTVNFVVAAKAPIGRVMQFARERGWRQLRLISTAGTNFKRDYFAESDDGEQMPMMSVFERDAEGVIRHFWSSEMLYAPTDPGQDPRHNGTAEPLWNLFDLTRAGRPVQWHEQLEY